MYLYLGIRLLDSFVLHRLTDAPCRLPCETSSPVTHRTPLRRRLVTVLDFRNLGCAVHGEIFGIGGLASDRREKLGIGPNERVRVL